MSAIIIEHDLIHYEAIGRGRPIVFIHGWVGSWRYWWSTMQAVSAFQFRAYAFDLWGFGDSGKRRERYDFESYVNLLGDFMDPKLTAIPIYVKIVFMTSVNSLMR